MKEDKELLLERYKELMESFLRAIDNLVSDGSEEWAERAKLARLQQGIYFFCYGSLTTFMLRAMCGVS